ncbi:MAG TPA: nuclear transport factor 2 family protein [Acidimicrobiia bacterium]|nr:nuclear transport factor 2 family protein [Acidimicrobiia bacterium]
MVPSAVPQLSRRNTILKGYAAFNDADWETMKGLLSANVVWHKMKPPGGKVEGRDDVIAYLQELRASNEAEFLGMAIKGDVAITVDFTHSTSDHGDHGCADRVLFDASGLICEVTHCAADTEHSHTH